MILLAHREWGRAVGMGRSAPVPLATEQGVIGQPHHHALAQDLGHRVLHRLARVFIDDVEDGVERLAAGVLRFPASQRFAH